ncbi:MAG TPA: hypothetical protein VGK64_05590 [Bryobacteraceae bacterium]
MDCLSSGRLPNRPWRITRRSVLPLILCPSLVTANDAAGRKEFRYQTLKALWEDLLYNRIKRKQIMKPDQLAMVEIWPVEAFMVLEGKEDIVGTVVITDINDGKRPSLVAYMNIPFKLKSDSPPLEDVRKGDRLGVIGAVYAMHEKGTAKGSNRYADTIEMFGRFGHIDAAK